MDGEQSPVTDDGAPPVAPSTADDAVDAVLARLVGVGDLPLRDQVTRLDEAHQRLQDRLAESDGAGR